MSFLNVSLLLLSYEDGPRSANPLIRTFDSKWDWLGIPTDTPRLVNIRLNPGESVVAASQLRALSYTGSTSFSVSLSGAIATISGSFGQRTGRSDGDGTTQWAIAASNELATITYTGTGTAPSFGSIQPGDGITIGAPFSPLNQGDFVVSKVGSNFVQYVNPIAQGETQVGQVDVYSNGPVQVGDQLDITSAAFSFPNRGTFVLTRVTDTFVQFSNPLAVPEVVTGVASGTLNAYPDSFQWMLMAVDRRLVVQLNGGTDSTCEVAPPVPGDLVKNPGLYLKRGKVYQVQVTNPGQSVARGMLYLAP